MTKVYRDDFFDRAIPDLTRILSEFRGKENLRFLEVNEAAIKFSRFPPAPSKK